MSSFKFVGESTMLRGGKFFIITIMTIALNHPSSAQENNSAFPSVPGAVVVHSPASTGQYIGSPSLALLPDGVYVASHDFFGPATSADTVKIYRSADRGVTWQECATIQGGFWSGLFVHQGFLYLLGTNRENGDLVIRRSTDGGYHWTTPQDSHTGLLRTDQACHTAPVPIVEYNGCLWRGIECRPKGHIEGKNFHSLVMSAPVHSNLLEAANWKYTNALPHAQLEDENLSGWLEGNAVVTPQGIVNVLRVQVATVPEKVALISINVDGSVAKFHPHTDLVDFPGGAKKFTIRYDAQSKLYWALSNYVPKEFQGGVIERTRNTLALICSSDLRRHWRVVRIILQHPDVRHVGFQYADWLIEGDDMLFVSRTAFPDEMGNASNPHNANFLTFHRVKNFRDTIN